jgi:uncharacterized protein
MPRYRIASLVIFAALSLAACGKSPDVPTTAAPTQTTVAEVTDAASTPVPQTTDEPATAEAPTLTPTPEGPFPGDGPWEVTFPSADGSTTLQGTVYGQGTKAVILAPMYNVGQPAWQSFATAVAAQGYRVLTFDYRGVGESEGTRNPATASDDLTGAVAYIKGNAFEPIVLIGAGLGGSAAIRVAAQDSSIVGAAIISAPRAFPPDAPDAISITDADLSAMTMPSIWFGTRNDMTQNVEEMFDKVGGTDKSIWIYEGSSLQGTYIFDGADGNDLRQRLIDFITHVAGA